jgi:hypothetical protein
MDQQMTDAPVTAFRGLRGKALASLLQLGFVRFHRVQLACVESPADYERFLAEVMGPRLEAIRGSLGVFGVGEHTRVLLRSLPALQGRIHCFIDNNASIWRQQRFGRPVLPPEQAVKECDAILLSTAVFQHVLRAELKRRNFNGPILAVDDIVPPEWFLAA